MGLNQMDSGRKPEKRGKGRDPRDGATTYLPYVPSFGWRPGQADFPVTQIAASDVPHARLYRGGTTTQDADLFPHVEVLSAPRPGRVTPMRVLAALVLVGAAAAAAVMVYQGSGIPEEQANGVPTATTPAVAGSEQAVDDDPTPRRPQPGFGGALPSVEESASETEPEPSATPTDADPTPSPPSSSSVLPGRGVVTVSARETDTTLTIAEKFDVSVASLIWSNDIVDPTDLFAAGDQVRVPRRDGVVHEIERGDTLESIAERYGVEPDDITGYVPNAVQSDDDLVPGELLLVPDGRVLDRGRIDEYDVQPGDTLTQIAEYYGLQPQTLVWANELPHPSLIHAFQKLIIPPGDGALVYAAEGDTVAAIAERFRVPVEDIIDYEFNELDGDALLQAGQPVMVPGDFLPPLPENGPQPAFEAGQDVEGPSTGTFIWPTEGWVSQEFHTGHLAVDIANEAWTPVNAMDGGVVIFAGWSDYGLGYAVGIDHGNGFQTWYGHFAAQPYVEVGQIIWQGGYLGPMGSTGRSTGPHLHLVVMKDGVYVNPLDYLE